MQGQGITEHQDGACVTLQLRVGDQTLGTAWGSGGEEQQSHNCQSPQFYTCVRVPGMSSTSVIASKHKATACWLAKRGAKCRVERPERLLQHRQLCERGRPVRASTSGTVAMPFAYPSTTSTTSTSSALIVRRQWRWGCDNATLQYRRDLPWAGSCQNTHSLLQTQTTQQPVIVLPIT